MAKEPSKQKKDKTGREPAAEYYKLKTEAVEDLVTADDDNSPQVSEQELLKYGAKKKSAIPEWLKIAFIKFWFAGAVYYFMVIGLMLTHPLDQIVIVGIVMGMVTDILTNNAIRFFAEREGANDKYLMFAKKRYMSFFFNIFYAIFLFTVVSGIYYVINLTANAIMGTQHIAYIGGEPLLFGLLYMLCDALLVLAKNSLMRLVKGAKNKNV